MNRHFFKRSAKIAAGILVGTALSLGGPSRAVASGEDCAECTGLACATGFAAGGCVGYKLGQGDPIEVEVPVEVIVEVPVEPEPCEIPQEVLELEDFAIANLPRADDATTNVYIVPRDAQGYLGLKVKPIDNFMTVMEDYWVPNGMLEDDIIAVAGKAGGNLERMTSGVGGYNLPKNKAYLVLNRTSECADRTSLGADVFTVRSYYEGNTSEDPSAEVGVRATSEFDPVLTESNF